MALDLTGRVVPDAQAKGWTVVGQTETLRPDPAGHVVSGVEVRFRTAKGVEGSVFVPKQFYNVTNVRAAVAAAAQEMDQVQGLSG